MTGKGELAGDVGRQAGHYTRQLFRRKASGLILEPHRRRGSLDCSAVGASAVFTDRDSLDETGHFPRSGQVGGAALAETGVTPLHAAPVLVMARYSTGPSLSSSTPRALACRGVSGAIGRLRMVTRDGLHGCSWGTRPVPESPSDGRRVEGFVGLQRPPGRQGDRWADRGRLDECAVRVAAVGINCWRLRETEGDRRRSGRRPGRCFSTCPTVSFRTRFRLWRWHGGSSR